MQRVVAIDLARFIAIVGMMAAHLLAPTVSAPWLENITSGFPSALFAVLGGFGVVFSCRKYLDSGRILASIVAVTTRGLVVVVIGVIMEVFPDHPIAVILVYYGFAIIVGAFLVLLPTLPLFLLTATLMVLSPLVLAVARSDAAYWISPSTLHYEAATVFVISVFVTGMYPVLTWSTYLAVGIILARFVLRAKTKPQQLRTALIGATLGATALVFAEVTTALRINKISPALAPANNMSEAEVASALRSSMYGAPFNGGWDAILIASPHSGSTADILRTAGASVTIICALVIIFGYFSRTPRWIVPLQKVGASPLTVYVLHIAMTAYSLRLLGLLTHPISWWEAQESTTLISTSFWWQLAVVLALGIYWAYTNRRGPLERLATWCSAKVVDIFGLNRAKS